MRFNLGVPTGTVPCNFLAHSTPNLIRDYSETGDLGIFGPTHFHFRDTFLPTTYSSARLSKYFTIRNFFLIALFEIAIESRLKENFGFNIEHSRFYFI